MNRDQYPAAAKSISDARIENKAGLVVEAALRHARYTELEPGSPMERAARRMIQEYAHTPRILTIGLNLSPTDTHDKRVENGIERYLATRPSNMSQGQNRVLQGAALRTYDALDDANDEITAQLSRERGRIASDKANLRYTIAFLREHAPHLLDDADI